MNLELVIRQIKGSDKSTAKLCWQHWDKVAKPLRSLGVLEEQIVKIAAIQKTTSPHINRPYLPVMCADNGLVSNNITQVGSEVTTAVAKSICNGKSSVCSMGNLAGVKIEAIDIGMKSPINDVRIINKSIAKGTTDFTKGPAMTIKQAEEALLVGVQLAKRAAENNYDLLIMGEMGIGNTSTSSALASVLMDIDPAQTVGRGAGLDNEGLNRKLQAVRKAIIVNKADKNNTLNILAKLGGFDIAGMAGLCLGGALYSIPVIVDGLIAGVSALVACRLCPYVNDYLLASHSSEEPAAKYILDELNLKAPINAGLRLGEGTGAVALIPILRMALAVYYNSASFDEVEVVNYKIFEDGK